MRFEKYREVKECETCSTVSGTRRGLCDMCYNKVNRKEKTDVSKRFSTHKWSWSCSICSAKSRTTKPKSKARHNARVHMNTRHGGGEPNMRLENETT